jgi:hypothetical protein
LDVFCKLVIQFVLNDCLRCRLGLQRQDILLRRTVATGGYTSSPDGSVFLLGQWQCLCAWRGVGVGVRPQRCNVMVPFCFLCNLVDFMTGNSTGVYIPP